MRKKSSLTVPEAVVTVWARINEFNGKTMKFDLSFKQIFCLVVVIVTLLVVGYGGVLILITWPINEYSMAKAANFGGSFGPLATLFSGLAFAGLIITINMQKNDLDHQRGQIDEQRKILVRQLFESTFFQMLPLHNEILKGIEVQRGQEKHSGREAIQKLYEKLKNGGMGWNINVENKDNFKTAYTGFYTTVQNDIGHYFRNLYHLVKFVDQSDIDDKQFYAEIIRTQLSSYELALLFYHCLSEEGRDDFKPLIEEYSLLKALPKELIDNYDTQKQWYAGKAFSSNTE